ncbi:MAG TPA: hypothetical protein VNB06_22345 [Thermoanaerobaculia bacterium]|nr:hypothetical protein [Thermoanaerobaculia bacterium]
MPSPELERLVEIGKLTREPPSRVEHEGLVRSGKARLEDARKEELSPESRFDLAYGAAHAFSLAALRWHGYRSDSRYLVFQAVVHTLQASAATSRILAKCHEQRNMAEYEGVVEIDERLLTDLLSAAEFLLVAVQKLPIPGSSKGSTGD